MTAVKSSKGGWKTIFHFLTKIFKNGQKTVKKGQKWPKMKIFRPKFLKKFFFSESIQNVSKRILNRKSWFRKNFPVENFSLGLYRFLTKMTKNENFSTKIFEKKFFFQKCWSKILTMWPFWSKTVESQRKMFNGEIFRNWLFQFKIRFETL